MLSPSRSSSSVISLLALSESLLCDHSCRTVNTAVQLRGEVKTDYVWVLSSLVAAAEAAAAAVRVAPAAAAYISVYSSYPCSVY
jgi:hypothetical protein